MSSLRKCSALTGVFEKAGNGLKSLFKPWAICCWVRAAASVANVGPTAVLVAAIVDIEMPARGLIKGLFCTKGRLARESVGLGGRALPGVRCTNLLLEGWAICSKVARHMTSETCQGLGGRCAT